jgi:hypothetical protein
MRWAGRIPVGLVVSCAAAAAAAAPLPQEPLQRACWLRHTAERTRPNLKDPTLVDFSNLRNGYSVRSPFLVDFAVRGMGVAPAGKPLVGTGHHHILVDMPLPLNVTDKIPFSDHHKHFGKGQTGTVLDLPPGRHKLRLLFADFDHRPYFVYSPEITVTVTGPRSAQPLKIDPANLDATCAAWYQDEVARPRPPGDMVVIANLRDGETVSSPFTARFSVDGYGVCAVGQSAERTGIFVLDVLTDGRLQRSVEFASGATQGTLSLPNGNHRLRLRFVDGKRRANLLPPSDTDIVVSGQERI